MKNYILGALVLIAVTLTSCGSSTVKLDNPEHIERLNSAIRKELKADVKVSAISLSTVSNILSTEVSAIYIYYRDADDKQMITIVRLNPDMETIVKENNVQRGSKPNQDIGRDVSDYDFSVAFSNIANAAQQVLDAGMPYNGLGDYKIDFSADPNKDKHSFSILSKDGTSVQGRNIVTEYYEFKAKADAAGNVTVEDLPEGE